MRLLVYGLMFMFLLGVVYPQGQVDIYAEQYPERFWWFTDSTGFAKITEVIPYTEEYSLPYGVNPTTVHVIGIPDYEVPVVRLDNPFSPGAIMTVGVDGYEFTGELLNLNPLLLLTDKGYLTITSPDYSIVNGTDPVKLRMSFKSLPDKVMINYETNRLSWTGDHILILGDRTTWISTADIINHLDKDLTDVNVRLISGKPHRVEQPRPYFGLRDIKEDVGRTVSDEYRVYELGVVNLTSGSTKVQLFKLTDLSTSDEYVLEPNKYTFEYRITIDNLTRYLPAGRVFVYTQDFMYLGEDEIPDTASNNLTITLLGVSDVRVERSTVRQKVNRCKTMITKRIKIHNDKDKDITVRVVEYKPPQQIKSNLDYEEEDNKLVWHLTIPAKEYREVVYEYELDVCNRAVR